MFSFSFSPTTSLPSPLAGAAEPMASSGIERLRWLLVLGSGSLWVLGFAPFSWPLAGWLALLPAWLLITRSPSAWAHPLRYGYSVGLIYFGGVFWWIGNVTIVGVIFLIVYLAVYPALWFVLIKWLIFQGRSARVSADFLPSTGRAFGGALLWVTLEWLRSWFLTGFDWDQLGATQAFSPVFRQLAALGGVPLLSFVLALVALLWAEGLAAIPGRVHRLRRFAVPGQIWLALFIVAFAFAYGRHHLNRHLGEPQLPRLTYACVQPNVPQVQYEGSYAKLLQKENGTLRLLNDLSQQAMAAQPDLLIWPEAVVGMGVFSSDPQDKPLNDVVLALVLGRHAQMLVGSQDTRLGKYYNSAYLVYPAGNDYRFQLYDKIYLVVVGEYLPFADDFPFLRQWVGIGADFTRGSDPKRFALKNSPLTFAPLICFEDTVAPLVDRAVLAKSPRPDFLVTITDDGWYQGVCAEWGVPQHLQNAIFRSVEHDLPLLRCANNGISCEVDQSGTVVAELQDAKGRAVDVRGIFFHTLVAWPSHPTVYEFWNNFGGIRLLSELVTVMLGLCFFLRRPLLRP